jgi:hypothetical protein
MLPSVGRKELVFVAWAAARSPPDTDEITC